MTPFIQVTLLSLGLAALITLIYRVLVKPEAARKIKDDTKFYKEKMNQAKKEGNREKMNEYATEMLKASQGQFKLTMKPMMVTMVMFILLLGWLNTSFGGLEANFSAGNEPRFTYNGANYSLDYENDTQGGFTVYVDLNDDGSYSGAETFEKDAVFELSGVYWRPVQATTGFVLFQSPASETVKFEMLVARAPFEIPFVGSYLSWFWWYLFLSVPSTIVFRRLAGVE